MQASPEGGKTEALQSHLARGEGFPVRAAAGLRLPPSPMRSSVPAVEFSRAPEVDSGTGLGRARHGRRLVWVGPRAAEALASFPLSLALLCHFLPSPGPSLPRPVQTCRAAMDDSMLTPSTSPYVHKLHGPPAGFPFKAGGGKHSATLLRHVCCVCVLSCFSCV